METKRETERKLGELAGLPFWNGGRLHNLLMLEFGKRRETPGRALGEYELQIECPWRLTSPEGIVVGAEDRQRPATGSAQEWDREEAESLCDAKLRGFMNRTTEEERVVEKIEGDVAGGFRLVLKNGCALEVFPCDSSGREGWRIVRR
jgi:hypothetical protein